MLSDAKFVLAGHAITSVDFLIAAALLLCVAAFLLAVAKRNRITVHPSPVTDEIIIQLGRIADAAERIAYQPLQNNISAAPGIDHRGVVAKPAEPQPHAIPYSMFGR